MFVEVKWLDLYKKSNNFKRLIDYRDSNRLSHCLILYSEDEVSNKYLANLFAMLINCNDNLCFKCDDCVKIIKEVHPDVINLPEKNDFVVTDSNFVVSKSQEKPMISSKKIFILNNFDKANQQSQNKLLKTIEEPEGNNMYILTATNLSAILPTILSRAQTFLIEPLPNQTIEENFPNLTKTQVYLSKGYLGNIINESSESEEKFEFIVNLLKNLNSSKQVILYSQDFSVSKLDFLQKISIMQDIFRDIIMFKNNKNELIFTNKLIIEQIHFKYNEKVCLFIIKYLNTLKRQVNLNVNLTYLADNLLMKILEVKYIYANK